MKKLYSFSFALTLLTVQTFGQSKNPADYKTNATGFYENKGQIVDQNYNPNPAVKYLYNGNGLNVQLRQTGFSYDTYTDTPDKTDASSQSPFRGLGQQSKFAEPTPFTRHFHRIDIELVGCNTSAPMISEDKSEAYYNYFTAGTPHGGVSEVHTFQKVTYKNIYPNIDLTFFLKPSPQGEGKGGAIEYNFIIHPGGDYKQIKLQYKGADGIKLDKGEILIPTSNGNVTENIPASYLADTKQSVKVTYTAFENSTFGFSIPALSLSALNSDLIIDPTPNLLWGTYYGGTNASFGYGIAVDASNNVYVTGNTQSTTLIATAGAYQTTYAGGGYDAFAAKFNSTGSTLIWGTYYGGTGNDDAFAIALDASDNVYITGSTTTSGPGIATAGAYQTVSGGASTTFIAKFNPIGTSLLWGTYYGTGGISSAYGIALDASNNVYVTGKTTCNAGTATAGAYKTIYTGGGNGNAFVGKFNSTGSSLLWGTYYGNGGADWAQGIALDASANVYITGYTNSSGIATAGAYQTTYGGGIYDAFVAKFNSLGSSLLWSTYYGGTVDDYAQGIALDASDNVYITGYTASTSGIATVGAYQTVYGGGAYDAFVAKFNSTGSSLVWGTYYGGTNQENSHSIALDASNNVYITGQTYSALGIATAGAYQTANSGAGDVYVSKFSSTGSSLIWGTYYGGTSTDGTYGLALDASINVYITGYTASSSGISTVGAYQTTITSVADNVFVTKFSNPAALSASAGSITNVKCFGSCTGSATVNASGGTTPYTYNWTPSGGTNATASNLCAGSYTCTVKDATAATVTVSVTITQPNQLRDSVSAQTNITCFGSNNGSLTVGVKGGTASYTYAWAPGGGTTPTITGLSAACYTVTVTDANSCTVTASACITQPNQLRDSISAQTNIPCPGMCNGSLTAGVKGGTASYTYLWAPGGQTTANITGLCAGCYTVTVTDANSCSVTASSCITQPALLRDSISSQTNILCNGGNTGSLTVGVKGGTAAYTYVWTPAGQTTATITGLSMGCYTVTVTDNNGCTATAAACITQPTLLKVSTITANPDSICLGGCSTISVTGTGGTAAYSYSWSNGNTTSSQSVCPASTTTYTVILTDSHGCTHDSIIKVVVNPLPTVTLSAAKDTQCVNATTDLLAGTPAGGTYSGPGVTANNFDANTAGSGLHKIMYTYTDNHGCTSKDSINIKVNLCTGVPEVNLLESQIKFYPNPFMQSINIDNSTNEAVSITMFNMMGQLMGTWQLDKGLNSINTSAIPSGVYMLQVKTKDGILNKKLVKVN